MKIKRILYFNHLDPAAYYLCADKEYQYLKEELKKEKVLFPMNFEPSFNVNDKIRIEPSDFVFVVKEITKLEYVWIIELKRVDEKFNLLTYKNEIEENGKD